MPQRYQLYELKKKPDGEVFLSYLFSRYSIAELTVNASQVAKTGKNVVTLMEPIDPDTWGDMQRFHVIETTEDDNA